MRWYRIAALSKAGEELARAMATEKDPIERVRLARKARAMNPKEPELLVPLIEMATKDSYSDPQKQAIMSIGAFANEAGPYAEQAMDALMGIVENKGDRNRGNLVVRIDAAIALGRYGEQASKYVGRLRSLQSKESVSEFKDYLGSAINAIQQQPELADIPLLVENGKRNAQNFKLLKDRLVPGAKLKIRPVEAQGNTIALGELIRVYYKDKLHVVNGKEALIKVPHYVIGMKTSRGVEELDIDITTEPRYEIWLYMDPEELPVSKYRGIWIKTTDPMARRIGEQNEDGSVTGMRVSQDSENCVLKIMKGGVPWTIKVPLSSCKPTMKAPSWGIPFAQYNSGIGVNDVVRWREDPSNHYIVDEISGGTAKIRPTRTDKGGGAIQTDVSQLDYLGRFEYGKGLVGEPHFTSPKIKAKPAAPAPAPKPALKPVQPPPDVE